MLGDHPLGSMPLSGITDAQATQTVQTTLRFASRSFTTDATDAPAHSYFPGVLSRGLRLDRRLKIVNGQFGALIETSFGEIQLNNSDGKLDYLINQYAADGRRLRLYIGATAIDEHGAERVKPFTSFALAYTATAGAWAFEHNIVRLRIESLANRLQGRVQQQFYAGTGGRNGTADIAGRSLPTAFGRCLNVPAQIVDPAILTYQFHGGTMDSITAVYDAGISVPFNSNHASYNALVAASVPPGTYASCLAEGFIRLGSIPVGQITGDIRGSNLNDGFKHYTEHPGGIIRKILINHAGLSPDEIDAQSFDDFDALYPLRSMSMFFPSGDQTTVEAAIERIAFGAGAFVGQARSGLYKMQRLDPPGTAVAWAFNDRNIISIERETLPYRIPWRSWGVGYEVNWTVQGDSDLAIAVTQSRRAFLRADRRYAFVSSPQIALRHLSSSGAPLREAFMNEKAWAEEEANRLIDFYGIGRALYRLKVKDVLLSVEIGQTVRITYPRWDLAGGKNFIVVGVADDADRVETDLLVFG